MSSEHTNRVVGHIILHNTITDVEYNVRTLRLNVPTISPFFLNLN